MAEPSYLPSHDLPRDEVIEAYFRLGFQYSEIIGFLGRLHGISISLRQLKRILKAKHLSKNGKHSQAHDVVDAVETELQGSGSYIGYRSMHRRLVIDYGLRVDQETVRRVIKALDPEGYDKLKPFGFCIHGAIDGYSRRILWLKRIEAWWSFLRKTEKNWWMNFFKDLRDQGQYCDNDTVQVECLKFCFMQLIQDELDRVSMHWNLHGIRPCINQETPPGRTDVLYYLPELNDFNGAVVRKFVWMM
ncbi:predicted protein [Nematostella vectensis]|uniref:Integrase core domain-containing protein n=1 Tax=Nematostella vectensis TaxID=45351 RepID=A7SXU2_NEMVE|nr:predicted protein [Nematostella vectensis]|eukprot:XP_001623586.1 predicted protein [Nematostella vectensis]